MLTSREQHRTGRDYLASATALLRRIRKSDADAGLLEAADLHWWWRLPRATDKLGQLFWFDDAGQPVAAVIATAWGETVALDPIVLPDASPDWYAHVIERGLAHAGDCGFDWLEVVIDRNDEAMRAVLARHGFAAEDDNRLAVVITSLAADARHAVSPLHPGYRLCSRVDTMRHPHHLAGRNGPDVEARLRETPLYRPDLDLLIVDSHDRVAAYALFWLDPETATALIEPVRTEDDHQRRGLARHLLTAGIDRLARGGAERIKVCFSPGSDAARDLYLGVGFRPVKQTVVYSRRQRAPVS